MSKSAANAANASLQLVYAIESLEDAAINLIAVNGYAVIDDPTGIMGDQGRIRDIQGSLTVLLATLRKEQARWGTRADRRSVGVEYTDKN